MYILRLHNSTLWKATTHIRAISIYRAIALSCVIFLLCILFCVAPSSLSAAVPWSSSLSSASELNYPPFALVLPNGQADGFSVDLLKEVAHAVGLNVTFKIGEWSAIKKDLEEGNIDVLPFVSYSKERDQYFDFTAPYIRMHGTIFVRNDNSDIHNEKDLKGKDILVMKDDTAHEYAKEHHLSDSIITTASYTEAFKLLSSGKYDAVIVQQITGWQLVRSLGLKNLKDVSSNVEDKLKVKALPLSGFEQKFCIAVREGNRTLLQKLNEGLAIVLSTGKYDELYDKWFSPILPEFKPSIQDYFKRSLFIFVPILAFLGVVGLFYFKREVRRRTIELQESEYRFKTLHNASFGGILIHKDGIILDCNQGLSDISGYSYEELIGMNGYVLIAPAWKETITAHMKRGDENAYDAMGIRKNGQEFPIRIEPRNIPFKGQQVRSVEIRDLTELRQAEASIRRSEEHLRSLAATIPGALYQFRQSSNGTFSIPYISEGILLFCGIDANTIINDEQSLLNAIHPDDVNHFKISLSYSARGLYRFDVCLRFLHRSKNQKERWARAVALPLVQREGGIQWNGILLDVTEQKQSEEALAIAKQQAEAASQSKSEFLANMSHEIRTPLNGVIGMLQLIKCTQLDAEQKQYADMALQSSKRLTGLLTDILDLSMVEAGKLQLNEEVFNLFDLLREVVELFRPAAAQLGVELNLTLDDSIHPHLIGDPLRLQQICINLVGNALKFTPKGKITLDATRLPYHLPDQERILFSVADTGKGIPDNQINHIFSPFSQGVQGYSRDYQGAGLGLAICHRLILHMQGSLAVETEENKGSTFYFCVSLKHASKTQKPPKISAPALPNHDDALNILLVEDDMTSSLTAKIQIEKLGHHVTAASHGKEALQFLEHNHFDIVLMDVQMPELNGIDTTKAIRNGLAGQENSAIPIIAMTAYVMPGEKESFLAAGMNEYISKPLDINDLKTRLLQYKIHSHK